MYSLSEDTETLNKINEILDKMYEEFKSVADEFFEEQEKEK